ARDLEGDLDALAEPRGRIATDAQSGVREVERAIADEASVLERARDARGAEGVAAVLAREIRAHGSNSRGARLAPSRFRHYALPMRPLLVLALFSLLAPTSARADAIAISPGFCPPGLDHGVQRHSDACTPRPCSTDAECGAGAACHEIAECWTQESTNSLDGRVLLPAPVMVD